MEGLTRPSGPPQPILAERRGEGWHVLDGWLRLKAAAVLEIRQVWVEVWDGHQIIDLVQVPVGDLLRGAGGERG